MSVSFRPAKMTHGQLFIGLSGPSWSGKTYSALRLATGIANGGKIVGIDTENGRMLHYASKFSFDHALLDPPFSPQHYGEVVKAAAALNPAVILIDSLTHEHTGEGGVLDMHDAELAKGKKDPTAWIVPKRQRKRLLMDMLRLKCHVIVCMRAEDQTEWAENDKGKLVPVPKRTLSGHVGWIPVVGKEWPYEFTVSLLLTPDALGVPKPVKLYEEHEAIVSLKQQLSEETGQRLAEWAAGGSGSVGGAVSSSDAIEARDEASRVEAASPAEGNSGPEPKAGNGTGLEPPVSAAPAISTGEQPSGPNLLSDAQAKKLDVLVGQLRDGGHITNEQVWKACGREPVPDLDGSVHWSPLRRTLTRSEAHALIERLQTFQQKVTEAAA